MIVIDSICIHSYNYTDLDRYGISSGLSQAEVLSISSPVAALVAPSFQARVAPMGSPTHALAALAMSSSRVLDPTHTDRHTHTTQTTQATRAFSSQVNEVFQNQPFSQKFEDATTRRVVLVFQHQVLYKF